MTTASPHQPESEFRQTLSELIDAEVVVDTATSYVYIGRLVACNSSFATLADADVRDSSEGQASKDHYAFEASRYGYRRLRKRVLIRMEHIISISRLGDVLA